MFIQRVHSKGKAGKVYVSVLLRESKRLGKKVVTETIAVLTRMPQWLIDSIEQAVKSGEGPASLQQLTNSAQSPLGLRSAESFGAVFAVHEVAIAAGIGKALGNSKDAKLALWQVLARVLTPASSLLSMVRLASSCVATALLKLDPFNEDDLYRNGPWVVKNQAKIETSLWNNRPNKDGSDGLFFYDVTSSYFEGQQNALGAFGYNRDKVASKKQVVMGLLTDSSGEPFSVSLFPGNTSDLSTFKTQIDTIKNTFKEKEVTIVGDRGMIRGPQQNDANEAGFHYISALHKAEIETLLKSGELQMSLFDETVHETLLEDGRRLVTRCNPVRREEMNTARKGFKHRLEAWVIKANTYLEQHPKSKPATQLKEGQERLKRGKLNTWMSVEIKDRTLVLSADEAKLQEHAKLDGCYAIISDLPSERANAEQLHARYKDLAKVEADFRNMKHGHLEIRPWYVQTEDNTRAHALTAMLGLKIRRQLESAWQALNLTVEEGLTELGKLCVMELYDKSSDQVISRQLPTPNAIQGKLLEAIGARWPVKPPPKGPVVATRVKLNDRRKKRPIP
jgi:Transposase DDE domain